MKCWLIELIHSFESQGLVFADTRNKARSQFRSVDGLHDADYVDVLATRYPACDGRESNPPTWRELVEDHGWHLECRDCGFDTKADRVGRWEGDACVCDQCAAIVDDASERPSAGEAEAPPETPK